MKKLITLVFAIALTASMSSGMMAQDAATTGTSTDSTSNKPQEKQGPNSRAKRQHVKGANGVSEQRQERTSGKVE